MPHCLTKEAGAGKRYYHADIAPGTTDKLLGDICSMEYQYLECDEDTCRACMIYEDNTFRIFLNKNALIEFYDGLFCLAAKYRIGEEASLWTNDCSGFPGNLIGYLEITSIHDEELAKEWCRHNGPVRFDSMHDRVDVSLTRSQRLAVYQSVLQRTVMALSVLLW